MVFGRMVFANHRAFFPFDRDAVSFGSRERARRISANTAVGLGGLWSAGAGLPLLRSEHLQHRESGSGAAALHRLVISIGKYYICAANEK